MYKRQLLCGGSATDLPQQGPEYAKLFHTVDSFDTHARIPEYFAAMDQAARESRHLNLISCGWDPGLFSMIRLLAGACLPQGNDYTFWGDGVSPVSYTHLDVYKRQIMPYDKVIVVFQGFDGRQSHIRGSPVSYTHLTGFGDAQKLFYESARPSTVGWPLWPANSPAWS